jgi:hypothetical protein
MPLTLFSVEAERHDRTTTAGMQGDVQGPAFSADVRAR